MRMSASPTCSVSASTSSTRRRGNERRQLLAHARDARAQHAQPRRAALVADAAGGRRRGPSAERVARVAREQAEPPPPVEHAHHRPARVAERVGQRLVQQARARRLLAPVDHERARPAARLDVGAVARRAPRPASASASTVGAGDTTDHGAPARAGALEQHVARDATSASALPAALRRRRRPRSPPRGRARARARRSARRPRRSSPARRAATRACAAASESSECTNATSRPARRRNCASDRPRDPSATATIVDPSAGAHRRDQLPPVASNGARRTTTERTGVTEHAVGCPVDASSGVVGSGATRLGGEAERRTAIRGPRQRQAIQSASVDHVGGRALRTRPRASRAGAPRCRASPSSATTQPRTRRPCSGTRTIAPTRTSGASASGTSSRRRVRPR